MCKYSVFFYIWKNDFFHVVLRNIFKKIIKS